jgi:pimeloyl-ACP methyl ester carboxylesterase
MYYQIHGTGQPLILVHGGLGSSDMFAPIMPELSKGRQVIAVDLQAHGRTVDIDRPLSFEAMADDIAALIHYLGFEKADVMGYSVGGEVALRAAIQHPEVVRKLIIVSATFRRDGWYPEIVAGMEHLDESVAEQMKQTPMYQSYQHIAPRPQDWPVLCKKLGVMFRNNYDWTSEVSRIKVPVLLVFGDADAVRTAHAVEFFELLGGGKKDGGWERIRYVPGTVSDSSRCDPLHHFFIAASGLHHDTLPGYAGVASQISARKELNRQSTGYITMNESRGSCHTDKSWGARSENSEPRRLSYENEYLREFSWQMRRGLPLLREASRSKGWHDDDARAIARPEPCRL